MYKLKITYTAEIELDKETFEEMSVKTEDLERVRKLTKDDFEDYVEEDLLTSELNLELTEELDE